MTEHLPPEGEQVLLSWTWTKKMLLVWRKGMTIYNYDGLSRADIDEYISDDCFWAIPDRAKNRLAKRKVRV